MPVVEVARTPASRYHTVLRFVAKAVDEEPIADRVTLFSATKVVLREWLLHAQHGAECPREIVEHENSLGISLGS